MEYTKSTFEDLEVWKSARALRIEVSGLVRSFPQDERYRLADQLLRASRSVTANIAEGYGRFHYQENIQFCRQARGSLYEIVDHVIVAMDEGYIDNKRVEALKEKSFHVLRMLNGYIQYLSSKKTIK